MFCLALRNPQYAWLHPPKPDFFQCFPVVPNPYFTLWKSVVSIWAINLSMVWKWRGRSWGKSTSKCVEICEYNNLLLSRFVVRVFSQKHSSTFVGNVGMYSVDTISVYQIGQFGKIEYFASTRRPYLQATRETQLSLFVLTLSIPVMCRANASFCGMLLHELPTKTI